VYVSAALIGRKVAPCAWWVGWLVEHKKITNRVEVI
jgi:hypothetical protein